METKGPKSLEIEHEKLHEELTRAMRSGGQTGEAAGAVMRVLQPHMAREDELVTPALALLPKVAAGEITQEMAAHLPKAAALEEELPRMLTEHGRIVEELTGLLRAASAEGHAGYSALARRLIVHAQNEEEILYPAALLVWQQLRRSLGGS